MKKTFIPFLLASAWSEIYERLHKSKRFVFHSENYLNYVRSIKPKRGRKHKKSKRRK